MKSGQGEKGSNMMAMRTMVALALLAGFALAGAAASKGDEYGIPPKTYSRTATVKGSIFFTARREIPPLPPLCCCTVFHRHRTPTAN